jgi:cytoskeletal protein CcmA (bactofilin family)
MFSRRPDRPKDEPRFATPPAQRPNELVAVPVNAQAATPAPEPAPPPVAAPPPQPLIEETVIGESDHFEGKLMSRQGVRILGAFSGSIESDTYIRMADSSTVAADVTADEVVVAGRYEGNLVARGRLEIAATGHIRGDIETPRLMLHEGGFIDGGLHMTRPDGTGRPPDGTLPPRSGGASGPARDAADATGTREGAGGVAGEASPSRQAASPGRPAGTGSGDIGREMGRGAVGVRETTSAAGVGARSAGTAGRSSSQAR